MKALKAAVIIMGIAIIIGVGALAVMWMDKMKQPPTEVIEVAHPEAETALMTATTVAGDGGKPAPPVADEVAGAVPETAEANVMPDVILPPPEPAPAPAPAPTPAPPMAAATERIILIPPTGGLVVPIPPGSRVVSTTSTGTLVDALVENPNGTRDLYTIERATGNIHPPIRFRSP